MQDPSSPLLKSDMAFQLYLTSLLKLGWESSIDPAVRRRDSLLAAAAASLSETTSPEPPEATTTSSQADTTTMTPTSSRKIAQAVLTGVQTMPTPEPTFSPNVTAGTHTIDMNKLAAALGSGAGVSGNPLQVTISERRSSIHRSVTNSYPVVAKGAWIPRLIRFLVLTGVSAFCA
jgi:ATP-dependent metalloprotease